VITPLISSLPPKVTPSYQARFHMHRYSKTILNCTPFTKVIPLIRPLFHCGKGGNIKGDYCTTCYWSMQPIKEFIDYLSFDVHYISSISNNTSWLQKFVLGWAHDEMFLLTPEKGKMTNMVEKFKLQWAINND